MNVIHILGAEAARDFASLLAQVRAGAEGVIEDGLAPSTVSGVDAEPDAAEPRGRSLSESLRLVRAHAAERGYDVVMDADFAADVEDRIRARKPRSTSVWD
jgi:hypothetical protein